MKQESERVRRENAGAGFGEIMAIIGREFRESKQKDAKDKDGHQKPAGVFDDPAAGKSRDEDHDAVVRKLEFLHLDS